MITKLLLFMSIFLFVKNITIKLLTKKILKEI